MKEKKPKPFVKVSIQQAAESGMNCDTCSVRTQCLFPYRDITKKCEGRQ